MADTIELEVVTPERQLVKEPVTEAQVPAREGYIGVLPGHAPLLSLLGSGPLTYTPQTGPRKVLAIHGGFVEVLPDHIRVLADLAERAEEIDLDKARTAAKAARKISRARFQSAPNSCGNVSRIEPTARARISASVHAGRVNSANATFTAAVIAAQPSTRVLSQSHRIASGGPNRASLPNFLK